MASQAQDEGFTLADYLTLQISSSDDAINGRPFFTISK